MCKLDIIDKYFNIHCKSKSRVEREEINLRCERCDTKYKNIYSYRTHMSEYHNKNKKIKNKIIKNNCDEYNDDVENSENDKIDCDEIDCDDNSENDQIENDVDTSI